MRVYGRVGVGGCGSARTSAPTVGPRPGAGARWPTAQRPLRRAVLCCAVLRCAVPRRSPSRPRRQWWQAARRSQTGEPRPSTGQRGRAVRVGDPRPSTGRREGRWEGEGKAVCGAAGPRQGGPQRRQRSAAPLRLFARPPPYAHAHGPPKPRPTAQRRPRAPPGRQPLSPAPPLSGDPGPHLGARQQLARLPLERRSPPGAVLHLCSQALRAPRAGVRGA